eukprot:7010810-Prymnesium_polylepis.1
MARGGPALGPAPEPALGPALGPAPEPALGPAPGVPSGAAWPRAVSMTLSSLISRWQTRAAWQ